MTKQTKCAYDHVHSTNIAKLNNFIGSVITATSFGSQKITLPEDNITNLAF